MEKCVYCGKPIENSNFKAKAHTRSFDVCCEDCQNKTELYVMKDKKYKLPMYILFGLGGFCFLICTIFLGGNLTLSYIGMCVAGGAMFTMPYPISSFESFYYMSIKGTIILTKIIGSILFLLGITFLILL